MARRYARTDPPAIRTRRGFPWRRLFLGLFLVFVLLPAAGGAVVLAAVTRGLPSLDALEQPVPFQTAQIFDRTGELLWEIQDPTGGKRTVVPLAEISPLLINATLAAEDARFYDHQGVDLLATARSAFITATGEGRTGASTLTQQLVRNVVLDPGEAQQTTISRKLREIVLAYQVDQRYSKDQILERYLNQVYYGNQSYGVEAAAQGYFGKAAKDLSLAEASLLAGLVQSPSVYDPTRRNVERTADGIPVPSKERQKYVLERMVAENMVSEQDARNAYAQTLQILNRPVDRKAPHWVTYVREQVEAQYGARSLNQAGLRIYTTLDLAYDQKMQSVLLAGRENIQKVGGNNAALIAVNPKTGEILAFNGSMDFNDAAIDGQVNVLLNERQPGSSIKPLIYGQAFVKGWSPGTMIDDVRTCWPDAGRQWCPRNFDNKFHGQTSARTALGNSLNIPAVKALEYAGIPSVLDLGRKMGITTWRDDGQKTYGLSLTLGGAEVRPIDLAQVYATFANNGMKMPLVAITRVTDASGRVLEDYQVPAGEQVLDPRAAYLVTNILSDPKAKLFTYGANTPLILDRPAASKTGTTDNTRDTWTAGYSPNLAIVVWVGNTNGQPMGDSISSMTAGKIWPEAMNASFQQLNLPAEEFVRPDGLVERQVCGDTAMRPGEPRCRNDLFYADRGPAPTPTGEVPPTGQVAPTAPPEPTSEPADVSTPAPTTPPTAAATSQPTPPARQTAPAPPAAPATRPAPPVQPPPPGRPAQPTAAPPAAPQTQPTPVPKPNTTVPKPAPSPAP